MAETREGNVFLAQLAHFLDEINRALNKVTQIDADLTVEERNLLDVTYREKMAALETFLDIWQIITSKQKELNGSETRIELIKTQRIKSEKEMKDICLNFLVVCKNILDKHLIPSSDTAPASEPEEDTTDV